MPANLIYPDDYGAPYFNPNRSSALSHAAGYTDYLQMHKPRTNLGDFGPESEARLQADNTYTPVTYFDDLIAAMAGRFNINQDFLDLGAGFGWLVKAGRDAGVQAWGLDNLYCYQQAQIYNPTVVPYLLQAEHFDTHPNGIDAVSYLQTCKPNQWDIVVTHWFLCCLADSYVVQLVTQLNRVARSQIHLLMPSVNEDWYVYRTKEQWRDDFEWDVGTWFCPTNNLSIENAVRKGA